MKWRNVLGYLVLAGLTAIAVVHYVAPRSITAVAHQVVAAPMAQIVVKPVATAARVVKRAMTRIRKGGWSLKGPQV